jgi:hypothetical protein
LNLPPQKIFSDTNIENLIGQNNYAMAADYLFHSQLENWSLASKNYDALKIVQTKSFWFDGFKIKVQFNPQRIKSTSAEVDEKSVAQRTCFLCVENLQAEQKGIVLLDKYILLCNPYPVFTQHFTISTLLHQPQRIGEHFNEMLELAKLLGEKYLIVYNGPACGASAPDHFHFQAGTKLFMPIEDDIRQMKNDYGTTLLDEAETCFFLIDDGLRRIIFIESDAQSEIKKIFKKVFHIYKNLSPDSIEPMLNIICSYEIEFGWSVIIFLREKHRPGCFYEEDPEKILVSPAVIDLGGVLVTPREKDFNRMGKELISKIFDEVSLNKKTFTLLAEKLKKEFS